MKGSRQLIKEFINAGSEKEIIFTLNSSHGINIVALGLRFKPGDVVLLTDKEHNSNLIPWLRLQKQGLIKTENVESDRDGIFDLDLFEKKLKSHRVRLVSMEKSSSHNLNDKPVGSPRRMPASICRSCAYASPPNINIRQTVMMVFLCIVVAPSGISSGDRADRERLRC